jgi:RNA polymerase sigma-70 factor (ECF subfamily)
MTREEFNNYVRLMSRKLYGFAFRILRNQEESEDAVQEVFIKMWNMGKKLDEYASIDALATTMTKNYCIDQLRKQKHLFQGNPETDPETAASPLELMERLESGNIIQSIIARMPDTYREMISLKDIDALSYEEIAVKTGQNINTLRVTLSRARALLREEYKKHFNEKRRT